MARVTLIFDVIKISTEGMTEHEYDNMQNEGHAANAKKYIKPDSAVIARVAVTQSVRLESVEDMAYEAAFEYASIDQYETQTVARLSADQTTDADMGVDLSL